MSPQTAVPDMFAASSTYRASVPFIELKISAVGMAVFVVFGTQSVSQLSRLCSFLNLKMNIIYQDVLRVWAFWLPKASPEISQEASYYVPRELKYGDGPLDSSFDFGSEKSTLAPFENVGHTPNTANREATATMLNGVTTTLSLPLSEGLQSTALQFR